MEIISRKDLIARITETVETSGIVGSRRQGGLSWTWQRTWAVDCSLHVDIDDPKVEVVWPSMHRTPAEARAAVALYSQVTDLACLLESMLRRAKVSP
jgi:hypothetical protein